MAPDFNVEKILMPEALHKAKEDFARVQKEFEADPSNEEKFSDLFDCCQHLNNYEVMRDASDKILKFKPGLIYAHVFLIIALNGLKHHEEVVDACQRVLALNSDESRETIYQYLGDSLLELKKFQEALGAYEKTIIFKTDEISDPDLFEKMAEILFNLNRNEDAHKYLERANRAMQENAKNPKRRLLDEEIRKAIQKNLKKVQ